MFNEGMLQCGKYFVFSGKLDGFGGLKGYRGGLFE